MARLIEALVGHRLQRDRLDQILNSGRVPQSLIFTGVSGIGKKAMALSFAQKLLCENTLKACGECGACLRVSNEQNEALFIVEPKGASIKMDQAREVLQFLSLRTQSKHRVIIIDQAHLLNSQASNVLLKSIEEPPEGTHYILIADTLSSLLPTLRSRSQVLRFSPLKSKEVAQITGAKGWVLEASQGRVDRARQLMNSDMDELRNKACCFWSDLVTKGSALQSLSPLESEIKDRTTCDLIIQFWQQQLRAVMHLKVKNSQPGDHVDVIKGMAQLDYSALFQMSEKLLQLEMDIKANADRLLSFEQFSLSIYRECYGRKQL